MKILYVVSNLYPNTAFTNRNKAAVRGFIENGCQCDVISVLPLISNENICLNNKGKINNSFIGRITGIIGSFLLLIRSIKKYDVVYCATSILPILRSVIWIAKLHHNTIVHERTELPDVLNDISGKSSYDLCGYLKFVKRFDRLFVISNPIKHYFSDNGVPDNKIAIFPMIVDPHRFDGLVKYDIGFHYMAYCGNMNNSKDGVAELIEAYGLSQAKHSYKLMLIGNKPGAKQKDLYSEIMKRYGIVDSVIFKGQVDRDEMPQILMNADLLVLCRPNNRQALGGFPTKLGEYLSTGNPVLVTRVGDIDKYIINGVNGYLAEPDNTSVFAAKIDQIFTDYDYACSVGKKGKELAFNEFNYYVQTKKVLDAIQVLIAKK